MCLRTNNKQNKERAKQRKYYVKVCSLKGLLINNNNNNNNDNDKNNINNNNNNNNNKTNKADNSKSMMQIYHVTDY